MPEGPQHPRSQATALAAGPALFAAAYLVPIPGLPAEARPVLGLALWMVAWWVTEALPLGATSLLPIVLLPLTGASSTREAAAPYANELIFLFLAGFLLAGALERWRCHERIAYALVRRAGSSPASVILGVMLATAFISMWISNTATSAMMFPIALAVGGLFPTGPVGDRSRIALLLGMAYAATIGGMGTLIGTPPNLILAGAAQELAGRTIDFGRFMLVGVPIVVVLLPATWALLVFGLYRVGRSMARDADTMLQEKARALGPVRGGERLVFAIFAATALAWFFREPKALGLVHVPGLTQLVPELSDAGVGLTSAVLLFALRGTAGDGTRQRLLAWQDAQRIPWDVLLLFGGGLSLAAAMEAKGLTTWIAESLVGLRGFPLPILFLGMAVAIVALGEFASNTAVAAVMMPLVVSLAAAVGQPPLLLMLVAGLSASLGFALPVATPPNAIVFGSGKIPMREMLRAGLVLDAVAILITVAALSLLAPLVFG